MNVGEVLTFNFTGGMQNVTLTDKGLYKLETWGAQGGGSQYVDNGSKGGYSVGYILINSTITLYIAVGGQGTKGKIGSQTRDTLNGGYNGGGNGRDVSTDENNTGGGSGGGATHIAKVSGLLNNIGYASFVTNRNGLIVAGGGGGSGQAVSWGDKECSLANNGTGGGTNGGTGETAGSYASGGTGGTQSSGGTTSGSVTGSFGKGGDGAGHGGGGGGGLYGGGYGQGYSAGGTTGAGTGGGGSGYTGGVPSITFKGQTYSPSMSNGQRSGNGLAKITLVAKSSSISGTLDGVPFESATFNGSEVETITFNGTSVA